MIDKLQKARDYATSRGGWCLSTEYINNKTSMEWKCNHPDHPAWFSNSDNIINKKSWCLLCSGKSKKSSEQGLQEARDYAASRGGMCLSTEYINNREKLEWKCHHSDHPSWFSSSDNVLGKNTWCTLCGYEAQNSKKDSSGLAKCQEYAKSKGGECLSTEYINQNTNMEWKCSNPAHPSWLALPKIVSKGSWCKYCYNEKRKS